MNYYKKQPAFSMLELVFVIVVIAILASLAIPRMERDYRSEARRNIVSALRYTQHMALIDDVRDPFDSSWQSKMWHISFAADGSNYTISSNGSFAVDTTDGKLVDGTATGTPHARLGKKYGISGVSRSGGCTGTLVAFDTLGRPHGSLPNAGTAPNYASYMSSDCVLTFSFTQTDISDLVVTIAQETGRVSAD